MARGRRSGGGGGMIGSKVTPEPDDAYATPEEIADRDKFCRQNPPTAFKQIGPEDTGGDAANPTRQNRGGVFKFDTVNY